MLDILITIGYLAFFIIMMVGLLYTLFRITKNYLDNDKW